ncbi:MAG: PH domain-containing protein, partial [Opitutaceae bacterium]
SGDKSPHSKKITFLVQKSAVRRGRPGNAGLPAGSRSTKLALAAAIRLRAGMHAPVNEAAIYAIERPHPSLWTYYLLRCLIVPPLFPVLILPSWFRYHTLRYRFSSEGISMRWGILFRREVIIQYARIQDIHLHSNVVERWLGLARVMIQTASGNAAAEMTLEGLQEFESVRDFLYSKMRGVHAPSKAQPAGAATGVSAQGGADLAAALREVAGELRATRLALAPGGNSEERNV